MADGVGSASVCSQRGRSAGARAILAVAAGLAGPESRCVASPWPLVAALVVALALPLVQTRRQAAVLGAALALALVVLLALRFEAVELAVALAPARSCLAALAAGRPQREAAGAFTGAGLALFAVGAPQAGIPLTLAGAVLMVALGLRRRRLAVTSA